MSVPSLPLSSFRIPQRFRPAAEKGRVALYLSSWLTLPAAVWLVTEEELKLLAAGMIGAALMPLILQLILFPAQLLSRKNHGRAATLGASAAASLALAAWTWAAASPVLEREYLPFLLRLLWAYCVAVLPLALMAAADEDSASVFAGAAQVQLGVLALAFAQGGALPPAPKLVALALLAALSTWAVDQARAHPPKR